MSYGTCFSLRRAEAPHAPDYADWIATYGAADYQALCHGTAALIDKAVESRLGAGARDLPRWAQLQDRFSTATQLEAQFWTLAG